jgi:hypothetical protein
MDVMTKSTLMKKEEIYYGLWAKPEDHLKWILTFFWKNSRISTKKKEMSVDQGRDGAEVWNLLCLRNDDGA